MTAALPERGEAGVDRRHIAPECTSKGSPMADDIKHDGIVKTTTDARQGITPGVTRKVLAISLALAVIAFVVAYHFTSH